MTNTTHIAEPAHPGGPDVAVRVRTAVVRARRRTAAVGISAAALMLLSACDSTPRAGTESPAAGINVVTSTTVYASIVRSIGGDAVSVTAILDSSTDAPHLFEATPEAAMKVSAAKLMVMNGGGYDDVAETLVDASVTRPLVLNAVEISGLEDEGADHEHGDGHTEDDGHDHGSHSFNKHVFYDVDSMIKLGDRIAVELGALDIAQAATFTANAKAFAAALVGLKVKEAEINAAHYPTSAVMTESALGYLLQDSGVIDVAPPAFSEAVESETDPSAADVAAVANLLRGGVVAVLVHSEQTSAAVFDQLKTAAAEAEVPVFGATETFPEGVADYVTWIDGTLDNLSRTLDVYPRNVN